MNEVRQLITQHRQFLQQALAKTLEKQSVLHEAVESLIPSDIPREALALPHEAPERPAPELIGTMHVMLAAERLSDEILAYRAQHPALYGHSCELLDLGQITQVIEEELAQLDALEDELEAGRFNLDYEVLHRMGIEDTPLKYAINIFKDRLLNAVKKGGARYVTLSNVVNSSQCVGLIENNPSIESLTIIDDDQSHQILLSEFFVEAVKTAPAFYRLAVRSNDPRYKDDFDLGAICEFLSAALPPGRPFMIEWRSDGVIYRDAGAHKFQYFDNDSIRANKLTAEAFQAALDSRDEFNLPLIYQGIASGHIRKKDSTSWGESYLPDLAEVDATQIFVTWRIIDYAARFGTLLLVKYLLESASGVGHERNSDGELALEIAIEHGAPATIKVLLTHIAQRSDIQKVLRQKQPSTKRLPLHIAIDGGKAENVAVLLAQGAHPNGILPEDASRKIPQTSPINKALRSGKLEIAIHLLKYGAQLPAPYEGEYDEEQLEQQPLKAFLDERDAIQKMLEAGNPDEISRLIAQGQLTHRYLSNDNRSALAIVFDERCFKAYALLRSKGFSDHNNEFSHVNVNNLTKKEQEKLRISMTQVVRGPASATVLYLMSKSRILQDDVRRFDTLRSLYKELVAIPEIETVLRVIATSNSPLDIIFDFDNDNVEEVSVISDGTSIAGSCEPTTGRLHIAAKIDQLELLGNLAHELTHHAMQILFNNDSIPYVPKAAGPEVSVLDTIKSEINARSGVDKIITLVYTARSYKDRETQHAEIIVRVPHMLAKYGMAEGRRKLTEQAERLYNHFRDFIIPSCEAFCQTVQQRGLSSDASIESRLALSEVPSAPALTHGGPLFSSQTEQTTEAGTCIPAAATGQSS